MDDSCAVCAEDLEWVAYGSCGHREVCSTCVVRLRFVLEDRRCCICKIESPAVFVTKAMGDYTRVMTDFSQFPPGAVEGQVGNYWYHEDTQAYFDDVDHYRMIKAMCRLSCSICDRNPEEAGAEGGGGKRRSKFRNIEQLKSHLYHRHKLFMCTLCLEGRKVFICEQKLYTRAQLNQHISTGDSEVDGSERERGGFMGHPMCEFCRNPFYGDNELYMHMSRDHYTCHICQRQNPGQYDYFTNYDDLETHFRQEHFLCEDEACLAKKFVVFLSEAEMKRHNAIEHGGHMSRSKRNAALQIPTSFRYRRSEQEQRQGRGRGRGFRPDSSASQLAMAIQASLETANVGSRVRGSSSSARMDSENHRIGQVDAATGQLESLTFTPDSGSSSRFPTVASQSSSTTPDLEESSFPPLSDFEPPEPSSRYAQALSQSANGATRLGEESFPPLPGASGVSKPKPKQLGKNSIAAHLRLHSKVVLNSTRAKPAGHHGHRQSTSASSSQAWPRPNQELGLSTSASSSQAWPRPNQELGLSTSASSSQPRPAASRGIPSSDSSSSQVKPTGENGLTSSSLASSAWNLNSTNRLSHSTSAPNLAEKGSSNHSASKMLPASATGNHALPTSSKTVQNVGDVHSANKSLVDRIRAGLGMDEDKFAAFKNISAEYRQGLINTGEYLSYVEQFGLSHLVLELAQLCPDGWKQKELVDAYKANIFIKGRQESGGGSSISTKESSKTSTKGKGKSVGVTDSSSSSREVLSDSFITTVRKLQANYKPEEEEVEVLSRDGYRSSSKGKSMSVAREQQVDLGSAASESHTNTTSSGQNLGGGNGKQRRKASKTSKFHRVRLGDGSVAAFLDLNRSDVSPEHSEEKSARNNSTSEGLPVRGVWRTGGGQKLFATSTRNTSK